MASNRQKDPTGDPWRDGPWNEIAGLIFFGLGFVVMLALVSHSSGDPSWNTTGVYPKATNWIGPVGANLADTLYQFFGLAAFFVPIGFFLAGWWQWQDEKPKVPKPRALGVFLIIISITGVLTMLGSDQPKSAFYLGGIIGRWLVYGPTIGLSNLLGAIGAIVALLLLLVMGMVIGTNFSIISAFYKFTPSEEEPGVLNSIGDRIRTWRGGPGGTTRQVTPRETGDQLARQHRGAIPARQNVNPRAPGGAGSRNRALPVSPDEEIDQLEAGGETDSETNEEVTRTRARVPAGNGAQVSPAAVAGAATRPLPARSSKRAAETARAELIDSEDEVDTFGGGAADLSEETANQKRSVDEMVADATVKRPDLTEEKEKPRPAAKVAKAVKAAISRIAIDFKLPSSEMLTPPAQRSEMEETELLERARQLAEKCREFNVSGQVKQISPGPVVTTFEFKPDPGVKYSRVTSLVDDLCLALKAESIRIDRIPGKSTVGIEVPNSYRETIRLREVIESKRFRESESKLTLALGKTIDGSNYAADLTRMPHLLIAGATGAGKSVLLNAILISLLYKASPEEVKMILVDPKRLELGLYADIPHLLTPIVTDPKRAGYALKWAVAEMESRYKHLAAFGVRNIDQYNTEVCAAIDRNLAEENPDLPKPLSYIVVVIDELADLMMIAAREVEESITRLAQMARAVGIHLVLATQRPSVDVITGLIKANFPSRISFRVSSKVDSRTIIDTNGAEALLGQGDMLFLPPGTSRLVRVHGAYVDEKEVKRLCDFVRSQGNPAYDEKVVMSDKEADGGEFGEMTKDEKYDDAVRIVVQSGKASTSLLQRHLRIGYGRAASIIDMMHREGIVGPEDGSKPRQVLIKADFVERLDQMREEQDR